MTSEKQPRHWLIITNQNEDTGQDDYFEDLIWEVEHSPECPKEEDRCSRMSRLISTVRSTITTPVMFPLRGSCIVGVDSLEFLTGTGDGWKELEPGRYEIRFWSEHQPLAPTMEPEEWNGGLWSL